VPFRAICHSANRVCDRVAFSRARRIEIAEMSRRRIRVRQVLPYLLLANALSRSAPACDLCFGLLLESGRGHAYTAFSRFLCCGSHSRGV
jgi:hypothetical protein